MRECLGTWHFRGSFRVGEVRRFQQSGAYVVRPIVRRASYIYRPAVELVRDTGIEPVTSSVSGKRSPAELIAPGKPKAGGGDGNRTRVHGFAGRCLTTRPLHRWGPRHLHLRADDGIRTRDPHLGKVMRYQLRYIRAPRTRSSPGAKHDDSRRERAHTNFLVRAVSRLSRRPAEADAAGIVGSGSC